MWVFLIGTKDGEHDLGLVTETVGETWAQWAVGEAARENGSLGWATLAAEERTGDFSGCVCTLFDIDGQWEEVHSGTDIFCCVCSGENGGTANAGQHRSLALLSKFAGLEGHGLVGTGNGTRHSYGVSHGELLSIGRVFSRASTVGAEAGSQSAMSVLRPRAHTCERGGSGAPAEATDNRSSCPL